MKLYDTFIIVFYIFAIVHLSDKNIILENKLL